MRHELLENISKRDVCFSWHVRLKLKTERLTASFTAGIAVSPPHVCARSYLLRNCTCRVGPPAGGGKRDLSSLRPRRGTGPRLGRRPARGQLCTEARAALGGGRWPKQQQVCNAGFGCGQWATGSGIRTRGTPWKFREEARPRSELQIQQAERGPDPRWGRGAGRELWDLAEA